MNERTIAGDIRRIRCLMRYAEHGAFIEKEKYGRFLELLDSIEAEATKLREENSRLKAALKPVLDAHIPDFSICDTCRDRSECEKNEDSETCEWYDIVESVRNAQRICNGGAK